MASTTSTKRLRRAALPQVNRKNSKAARRINHNAVAESNWLALAREARARTELSVDSTELLRELRAGGVR